MNCPKCGDPTAEWLFKSEMWWCGECHLIFSKPIDADILSGSGLVKHCHNPSEPEIHANRYA